MPWNFKAELDDFDKCVVRRTVNEMYGRKKIRQFTQPAVYHLRNRHPNCPRALHVPATLVLGRTLGRMRKQQTKMLATEIEILFFYINSDFAINCSQSV